MKLPISIPVIELAKLIGAYKIIGDETLIATGINEIHKVEAGDITFSDVAKYFEKSLQSAATIIILNAEVSCPDGKAILLCENPFEAYNNLVWRFRPFQPLTTSISPTATIGEGTIIEPNVVIGHYVTIGENCHIQANTTIGDYTVIGNRVTVQPNCIIGSDAFYYKRTADAYLKWRSGGRTILEDDTEIGAGCTINKGVSGDTIIGMGSKLDSQVHIGHGAVIGKHCLFAAQVGIGGKTIIEDKVILYGQVGVAQNITIGAGAVVLAKSGVSKSLEGGKTYFGAPAQEAREMYKELVALRQLANKKI